MVVGVEEAREGTLWAKGESKESLCFVTGGIIEQQVSVPFSLKIWSLDISNDIPRESRN